MLINHNRNNVRWQSGDSAEVLVVADPGEGVRETFSDCICPFFPTVFVTSLNLLSFDLVSIFFPVQ